MPFQENDVGVLLTFTCTDPDGAAFDLTGYTVKLIVFDNANSPFTCDLENPSEGIVTYEIQDGDFTEGVHRAQIQATLGTNVFHTELFNITVRSSLSA